MTTLEKIQSLFLDRSELSVNEIANILTVSKQYVHRILNDLIENDKIVKIGSAPKTIYKLKKHSEENC